MPLPRMADGPRQPHPQAPIGKPRSYAVGLKPGDKPFKAQFAEPGAAPGLNPDGPAAVLVMHGMGQQIPFETLEDVAKALQDADGQDEAERGKLTARTVMLGDQKAQRVELRLGGKAGREVHLYEAYWAPITEGVIDLRGVMGFLWRAGMTGVLHSHRTFKRWMFGDDRTFQVSRLTRIGLLVATLTLGALMAYNAVIAAMAAFYLSPVGKSWPSPALLVDLSCLMLFLMALLALAAAPAWVTRRLRRRAVDLRRRKAPEARVEAVRGSAEVWGAIGLGTAIAGFLIVVAGAVALLLVVAFDRGHGIVHLPRSWSTWTLRWGGLHYHPTAFQAFAVVWAGLAWACWKARKFIVQFVGDVAIYISPQVLDTFAEKRKEIKETARALAQGVYACRGDDPTRFQYAHVAVVGHSLGSVIAYDTLNRLLDDDGLAGGATRVGQRTALLLTFGSPLDKTAFLFGVWGSKKGNIREKLAASVQPLIQAYEDAPRDDPAKGRRPFPWLNLHARSDIISGGLDYYDHPDVAETEERHVQNRVDPYALTPLMAHVEYWSSPAAWGPLRAHLLKRQP
ncbi:MAG: hypothetical protein QOI63_1836 [Thermoplasmata archaeon]|nr:hypothetical protein [Thermoplasmata archaeon]